LPPAENTVLISAVRRWGLTRLMEEIGRVLAETPPPENPPDF
jgi:hypothetical protein